MPKQSYGPVSRQRSLDLLLALLDFANDALAGSDRELEALRSHLQCHWTSDSTLIIRTKLRYLQALSRLARTPLTLPQLKTALKQLETHARLLTDCRAVKRGSDVWHFSVELGGDRWEREAIALYFVQRWESNRGEHTHLESQPSELPDRAWKDACRRVFDAQLTTNPLTACDGMMFELQDLYVPLGIVRRDRRPTLGTDAEETPQTIYEPVTLFQTWMQADATQRLAAIGEPGTGKTTLLQRFAIALFESEFALPVWISLADLNGRSLEDYVRHTWLGQALGQVVISDKTLEAFAEACQQGWVWLLLDAADEMGGESVALAQLARDFKGWLGAAHIVVTCRANVWESGKNALAGFTTYQPLGFEASKGGDRAFVQNWFRSDPALGDSLIRELRQRDRKRVRAIAQKPLYLALTCRVWTLTRGKLPATKASLYAQFVEALYVWKQELFPTTFSRRQQLEGALAALACRGTTHSTFRLSQSLVQQEFAQHGSDLLELALQLGWLSRAGVSMQTGETVYAFYHPTFQEYFAARAISDWRMFLPDFMGDRAIAPIFESHWQEVILLWLGRDTVPAAEKAAFLKALLDYEDECGGFYRYRAYCLAVKGLAEYPDLDEGKTAIAQLVRWRFGCSGDRPPLPIVEQAGIAIARTDAKLAIAALEAFVQTSESPIEQWLAAHSLGKNRDPGNPVAIATLERLLERPQTVKFRLDVARSLGAIAPRHPRAVQVLSDLIQSLPQPAVCSKAALRLGKLDPGNALAMTTLEELLEQASTTQLRSQILEAIAQLNPDSPLLPPPLPTLPKTRRRQRHKTAFDLDKLIANLAQKLERESAPLRRIRLAGHLGSYVPNHPLVLPTLLHSLQHEDCQSLLDRTVEQLAKIATSDLIPDVIPAVRDIYRQATTSHPDRERACFKLLWQWSDTVPHADFVRAWGRSQPSD